MANLYTGDQILRDEETLSLIQKLSSSSSVVFYCGSGVTRDRTGLGWAQLVRSVHELGLRKTPDKRTERSLSASLKLHELPGDPKQKASAVCAELGTSHDDEDATIGSLLQEVLYQKHGWSEGALIQNIAELVVTCASNGMSVTVITTNYDTYIEKKIESQLAELQQISTAGAVSIPKCLVSVPGISSRIIFPSTAGHGSINVINMHGRVPPRGEGTPEGKLVFSEDSYRRASDSSRDVLTRNFNHLSSLIIVGASLNDEPLVNELLRAASYPDNSDAPRVVILGPPDESVDLVSWKNYVFHRGKHLGIRVLTPPGFSQVAQLVEEMRIQLDLRLRGCANGISGASYSSRLEHWWKEWSSFRNETPPEEFYATLRDACVDIRTMLESWNGKQERETLRIELWIRKDESLSRKRSGLQLLANSTGPLFCDDSDLRFEEFAVHSRNASVKTFMEGRPQVVTLRSMGYNDESSSRWKSFLCVPIRSQQSLETEQASLVGSVPVGVITLASTLPSIDQDELVVKSRPTSLSSFSNRKLTNEQYRELVDFMSGAAALLLDPSTARLS